MTVIGYRKSNFKGERGEMVSGMNIYVAYPIEAEKGAGQGCDRLYMTAMLSTITEVFTIAIGWIGTVASTITDTPAADGRLCAGLRRYRCRPVQAYVQHLTHRGAA